MVPYSQKKASVIAKNEKNFLAFGATTKRVMKINTNFSS